jgi:hypothetical protein
MTQRFRTVSDVVDAMKPEVALESAQALVKLLDDFNWQPPERWLGIARSASAYLDRIANALCIDAELKTVMMGLAAGLAYWTSAPVPCEVRLDRAVGGPADCVVVSWRTASDSNWTLYSVKARYVLPALANALRGLPPPEEARAAI